MDSGRKSLALVTGITGYLGTEVALCFLRAGYRVRGTARSQEKIETWRCLHASLAFSEQDLEVVEVVHLAEEGCLDEFVKGCDVVAHTASPLYTSIQDNIKDGVDSAINAVVNALKSAVKEPSIKRFIFTSSSAAFRPPENAPPDYPTSEADWTKVTYEQAATSEDKAFVYVVAKTLAEKVAWEWMAQNQPHFALTTILPTYIFGAPTVLYKDRFTTGSLAFPTSTLKNKDLDVTKPGRRNTVPSSMCDVKDVALVHVLAVDLDVPKCAGQWTLSSIATNYRKWYPDRSSGMASVPATFTPQPARPGSSAKLERDFGIKLTDVETTLRSTAEGWFKATHYS